MSDIEYTMLAQMGGTSVKLAVSTTSAPTMQPVGNSFAVVTPDVDVFFRRGTTPVAVSDGTDQLLKANISYRLYGFSQTDKLAFITASGTGNVYISPGA